jgi:hypothetical protein
MTRKPTRNSPPRVVAFFVGVLILLIAVAVLAQVTGAGRPTAKSNAVLAQLGVPASAQAELPLIPRTGPRRFSASRSQTKRHGAVPMDPNPPHFEAVVTYGLGGRYPVSVVVADVNLDGRPDLVVASGGGDPVPSSVGVLLGNGDGTFQPTVSYDFGPIGIVSLAVADLNLDGKPDLIVSSAQGPLGVLLGNGDGTFQPVVISSFGGNSVAAADINRDGKPDLVVVGSTSVVVQLGNGDGTFQDPVYYASGGGSADGIAIADLNHDGKADVVVTNGDSRNIGVLLGNGDGTFAPAATYDSGGPFDSRPYSPVVADVNGDGKPDLVVTNSGSGTVAVLLGNGDGTFQPAVTNPGGSGPLSVAVADLNGDGVPDVLVSNSDTIGGSVYVLLGNGDGTFQGPIFYDSGGEFPYGVAIADVNHDGRPDLFVVNRTTPNGYPNVGVLLNNTGAPPTTTTLVSSLNPASTGRAITYTATVKAQSGGAVTGSVMFQDNGLPLANVGLANNQAACTTTYGPRAHGQHAVTATYSGDVQNAGSTSTTLIEYVEGVASKTVVTTSGSPSLVGEPVTFTATVTSANSGIPDGELVTFNDGTTPLGSMTLKGGTAAFTTSSLSAKTHYIKASYAGDRIFKPSNGLVTQIVDKHPTTTTLGSSLNPSPHGQAVTFISRVASAGPIPTGKVGFKDGTLGIGSATLISGVATLTKSALTVGTHSITAQYLGDAVSGKSASAVLSQVVK